MGGVTCLRKSFSVDSEIARVGHDEETCTRRDGREEDEEID